MNANNKGFSLIELMIVIAIIGILATIAVPSYQTYVMKSKVANLLTHIQAGQLEIAEYVASTGDTSCNNLPAPTLPSGLDYYGYGEGSCLVVANGLASDFGGEIFGLLYNADVNGDGSITWECYYYSDIFEDEDVPYAPNGCINDW